MKFIFSLLFVFINLQISANDELDQNFFDSNDNFTETIYKEENIEEDIENRGSPIVNPPDEDDFVPINDYLPLLAVAAVGLGFYYRKELKQITK